MTQFFFFAPKNALFGTCATCCNVLTVGHLPCGNPVCMQASVPRAHEYVHCSKDIHARARMKSLFIVAAFCQKQ
jgi:hypothetical protein